MKSRNPLVASILGAITAMMVNAPASRQGKHAGSRKGKEGKAGDKLARKAADKRITLRHPGPTGS